MSRRALWFWRLYFVASVILASAVAPSVSPAAVYPLKVSANGRYLVDQNNNPFFFSGDDAWSLISQLTNEDVATYLDDRKAKGFNALWVGLIDHMFATNAPADIYGDAPFTGAPFTTPNEAYFAHADAVITAAAQRGILVLLDPLYLGYGLGDQGWGAEVLAASTADLESWGQYVGSRYKNFDNILWVIGGDTDPTPVLSQVSAFVAGLTGADSHHLLTADNDQEEMAVTPWAGASWLTVNNIYTYSPTLYQQSQTAYALSPVMPYYLMESYYENENYTTPQRLREEAYWPSLSGGFGYIFGNCPIWMFGYTSSWCGLSDWKAQLDSPGSVSMMYAQKLFNSRAWQTLVPDFTHTVLTAGYGTWGDTDYATAARTADGATTIAYLPTSRTITLDMTQVSGTQAKAWWYNPATGAATLIGTFATSGTHNFTPPSDGDWVFVLDDASKNLPTPGSSAPTKIGVFRNGTWYLDTNGNGVWYGCGTDTCSGWGQTGDIPVVGDWTGSGTTKIGIFRPSNGTWYLDTNGNGVWDGCGTDTCSGWGQTGDIPVVGRW